METLTHGKSSPSRTKQGIFKSPLSPGFPLGVQCCPGGGPRAAGGTVPPMGSPGEGGGTASQGPRVQDVAEARRQRLLFCGRKAHGQPSALARP